MLVRFGISYVVLPPSAREKNEGRIKKETMKENK
jgi:hypothetical protein